jgi:hypothetical protein
VVHRPVARQRSRNKQQDNSIAMQQHGKHASTTTEFLLETVFSARSIQSGYKEDN